MSPSCGCDFGREEGREERVLGRSEMKCTHIVEWDGGREGGEPQRH